MTEGRPPNRAGMLAAILAALALRRSGIVPHRPSAPQDRPARDGDPAGEGHETRDVNVRNTILVMAGLALAAAAVIGGMAFTMRAVAARQRADLPALTPQQTQTLVPPPPNLQANPYADLDKARAASRARLDGYAYLDPARSRARIPLDRAMQLAIGRSLDGEDRGDLHRAAP
ncbi:hypothetical protein [Methylobacterium aerolatum]|uniref:Uncharacterized protein n=1 Tax=Methylobacterium aerolatum TaxID=418708 RepID=A0ABU0I2P1_9HYPH|nr:hypothetical protein [Methylobacterium aerolatum]MDQ0448180.1 hypothetical protein [Methylobacterium aerolatum]GJD33954.1 hypothetical protein FMGBMHLM_0849 [Methylobacterium aerolatum]